MATEAQKAKWREYRRQRAQDPAWMARRRAYVRADYRKHIGERRSHNARKERHGRRLRRAIREAVAVYGWQTPDHMPNRCMCGMFSSKPCVRAASWGSPAWHICNHCRIRMLAADEDAQRTARMLDRYVEVRE